MSAALQATQASGPRFSASAAGAAGPSTTSSSGAANAPAPPLLKQLLERRLELAAVMSGLWIQAIIWAATGPQLTATQHGRQAALCALWMLALSIDMLLPQRTWVRCRFLLITFARVVLGSVPSNRSITEGQAVILHAPATPGVLGALRDYMRISVGTRVLLTTLMGTLLCQPPTILLVQQIAVMLLVRADYCSCSIFQDPLSQARIAAAWDVLELASMFVQPWGPTHAGRRSTPQAQCAAVLTFHKLAVGILLPTVVAVYLGRQEAWASTTAVPLQGQREPAQPQHAQQQRSERGRQQQLTALEPASCIQQWGRRLDQALHSGCTRLARRPAVACLAAWVVLGNLWLAAVGLAQLRLA